MEDNAWNPSPLCHILGRKCLKTLADACLNKNPCNACICLECNFCVCLLTFVLKKIYSASQLFVLKRMLVNLILSFCERMFGNPHWHLLGKEWLKSFFFWKRIFVMYICYMFWIECLWIFFKILVVLLRHLLGNEYFKLSAIFVWKRLIPCDAPLLNLGNWIATLCHLLLRKYLKIF